MELGSGLLLGPRMYDLASPGTGSQSDDAETTDDAPHAAGRMRVATAGLIIALACLLLGRSSLPLGALGLTWKPLATDIRSVVSEAANEQDAVPIVAAETGLPLADPSSVEVVVSTSTMPIVPLHADGTVDVTLTVEASSFAEVATSVTTMPTAPLRQEAPATATPGPWWQKVPAGEPSQVTTTASQGGADWFDMLAGGDGAGLPLAPMASMHDGNVCGDDEELMQGLCYKKCSTLTYGEYPVRTSAWTCCKKHPCTLLNLKHDMGMCSGFDVAGDLQGKKACPHLPGSCLTNEELYLGMCYKKCSILVPEFPIRAGTGTCCKTHGLRCTLPQYGMTSTEFAVGGGTGLSKASPKGVHLPLSELTEST